MERLLKALDSARKQMDKARTNVEIKSSAKLIRSLKAEIAVYKCRASLGYR